MKTTSNNDKNGNDGGIEVAPTPTSSSSSIRSSSMRPSRMIMEALEWPADHVKIPFVYVIQKMAVFTTRRPILVLIGLTLLSIATMALGIFTNLRIETNENILWTPMSSETLTYSDYQTSFYEGIQDYTAALLAAQNLTYTTAAVGTKAFYLILYRKDTANILTTNGVETVFQLQDAIKGASPDYNVTNYHIESVASFFNHDINDFSAKVQSDTDISQYVSSPLYVGDNISPRYTYDLYGYPTWSVDQPTLDEFGYPTDASTLLSEVQSFRISVEIPDVEGSQDVEDAAIDAILSLRSEWESDAQSEFVVEISSYRSFESEFIRSIVRDLPLLPSAFLIMVIICCFIYFERNQVKSSSLTVGTGAIVTVVLSLATCKFSFGSVNR